MSNFPSRSSFGAEIVPSRIRDMVRTVTEHVGGPERIKESELEEWYQKLNEFLTHDTTNVEMVADVRDAIYAFLK